MSGWCRTFGVRTRPRAAFGICSAIESDATTHRTPTPKVFASKKHFPAHGGQAVRKSLGACDPRKTAQPRNRSGSRHTDHRLRQASASQAPPPFRTDASAGEPATAVPGEPPSLGFGVAGTPATTGIINPTSPRGELARFSREFPHNRFRVAPTDEAAALDVASASALEAAGSLLLA